MSAWTVRREPSLDGYAVEWAEPGALLLSRRNRLYRSTGAGAPLTEFAALPGPRWKAELSRVRVAQRLLRFLFYNVLKLPDGSLFTTFDKCVAVFRAGRFEVVEGMLRPCRVLRSACALSGDGNVYFGEYFGNTGRDVVHVYRYTPGSRLVEVVHSFTETPVRHVHGIYYDRYTETLWCMTGDDGAECRFSTTRDGFHSVETFGSGDESWRCVSALFTKAGIYYGTDAEFEKNRLYRIDRESGRRDVLGDLDGPVYYSHAVGDDLFFAVTAELCPSQVGRSATLWHVDAEDQLSRVESFAKDRLSVKYFMPGTLHFSRGPGLGDRFYLNGVGVRGENRTFIDEKTDREG